MQVSAFSACVDIISSDLAGLPFPIMNDGKPDTSHDLYHLLDVEANEYMTAQNARETIQQDILVYGNGYAWIDKDDRQRVRAWYPIPAFTVTPQRLHGQLLYYVQGVSDPIPADQMLHIPGLPWDGTRGKSIIENHANSLGIALAQDEFAAKFFANGTLAEGYLSYPGKLSQEAKANLQSMWHTHHAGLMNAHDTPVLSEGLKYETITIPPEQAQFLESRKYSAVEICRLPGLRVPPHMIGDLGRATWSNIEAQGMDYVTYTLRRWVLKWEAECNRKLLLEAEKGKYRCRMQVDDLQRGDQDSRYKNYATAIQWGWMTPKQVAEKEGLDSDGLSDEPLTPLNMGTTTTEGTDGKKSSNTTIQYAPKPEPEPKQNNAQTREQKREKFRALIEDAAQRCCTKEKNAIARIAKNNLPDDVPTFETNCADFWADHPDTIRKTFRPVVATYSQKRCDRILHALVEDMKNESLDALANAVQEPSPIEAVTGLLGGWAQMRHVQTGEKFCEGKYE
jgi:HK97 family phage portal protein